MMLTDEQAAALQSRAMVRAWGLSATGPVCTSAEASPGLRAAIAGVFPLPVEYFQSIDDLKTGIGSDYRCTVVSPQQVRTLRAGLVGVDVWVLYADLRGGAQTFLFRWDGAQWVDTDAQQSGITVTTATS